MSINIRDASIDEDSITILLESLVNSTSTLGILDISGMVIILPQCNFVICVCMCEGNDFADDHFPLLCSVISAQSHLKELYLDDIEISEESIEVLINSIKSLVSGSGGSLQILSLCFCGLTTTGIVRLSRCVCIHL